ncbi:solanesyl diphosphate synthase 1 [Striga asiatica]|uniref:Solanesyl diphosphate synthase 1 n=1 Tax=Striga asiatica TaxID=4170 RepID=A0A5A7QE93_STRAF|nr:solanesyl diphosphate synthase 1 [Striga asiatica]
MKNRGLLTSVGSQQDKENITLPFQLINSHCFSSSTKKSRWYEPETFTFLTTEPVSSLPNETCLNPALTCRPCHCLRVSGHSTLSGPWHATTFIISFRNIPSNSILPDFPQGMLVVSTISNNAENWKKASRKRGTPGAVRSVHHAMHEQVGPDSLYQIENRRFRPIPKVLRTVRIRHGQEFAWLDSEVRRANRLPLPSDDPGELERDAEGPRVAGQPFAGLLHHLGGPGARPGEVDGSDPEPRGPAGPKGQASDEGRPLEAVDDAEVDDVDTGRARRPGREEFVRDEVRDFPARERRDRHVVSLEAGRGGDAVAPERFVHLAAGPRQAGLKPVGKVVGQPLGPVAVRGRVPSDFS